VKAIAKRNSIASLEVELRIRVSVFDESAKALDDRVTWACP